MGRRKLHVLWGHVLYRWLHRKRSGRICTKLKQMVTSSGRGSFICHVWILDLRNVLLLGLAVFCSPLHIVPLSLSTCPMFGKADCTDGRPYSLVSRGPLAGRANIQTRYVFFSHGVPWGLPQAVLQLIVLGLTVHCFIPFSPLPFR